MQPMCFPGRGHLGPGSGLSLNDSPDQMGLSPLVVFPGWEAGMDWSQSANIFVKASPRDEMGQPEGPVIRAGVNWGLPVVRPVVCRQRHQSGEWSVCCCRGTWKSGR